MRQVITGNHDRAGELRGNLAGYVADQAVSVFLTPYPNAKSVNNYYSCYHNNITTSFTLIAMVIGRPTSTITSNPLLYALG